LKTTEAFSAVRCEGSRATINESHLRKDNFIKKTASGLLACLCTYDAFLAQLQYSGFNDLGLVAKALPIIRLLTPDLAIRWFALHELEGRTIAPDASPIWTTPEGFGSWLKRYLDQAAESGRSHGEDRISRRQWAAQFRISESTLDRWLDQECVPQPEDAFFIAEVLSRHLTDRNSDELLSECGRHILGCAIARELASVLGRKTVNDVVGDVQRMASHMQVFHRLQPVPKEVGDRVLVEFLLLGSNAPLSGSLLKAALEAEEMPSWRNVLRACLNRTGLNFAMFELQTLLRQQDAIEGRADSGEHELTESDKQAWDLANQAEMDAAIGEWADAVDRLGKAVMFAPTDARLHRRLGLALLASGDLRRAYDSLAIASQLNPYWTDLQGDVAAVLVVIGENHMLNSNTKEAADYFNRAIERVRLLPESEVGKSGNCLQAIGTAYFHMDDFWKALPCFEKCIELGHQSGDLYDWAAHCCFMVGENTRGRDYAKTAHRLGHSRSYDKWQRGEYNKT